MIIANLNGQMGNQMFIYATAYAASQDYNDDLSIYKYEYDTFLKTGYALHLLNLKECRKYAGIPLQMYWNTTLRTVVKMLNRAFHKSILPSPRGNISQKVDVLSEVPNQYTPLQFDPSKSLHLIDGFRQSPLYFDKYYSELCEQFTPAYELNIETIELIHAISVEKHAVSVHFRRGDYVKIGCCLNLGYYKMAIERMQANHPESRFFIFSDDINWVKQTATFIPSDAIYVTHPEKSEPFDDIWAMSKCHSNIIANSSFSWWAAYLNTNKDKIVIAPKKIYENNNRILPVDWHIIED